MTSRTRGSIGVVEWLSRKMGSFTAMILVSSIHPEGE
jgi:hypothetical protein